MEARFIILHSRDPLEILLSTVLIRRLKQAVDQAWICSLIPESGAWLLDNHPQVDEMITYNKRLVPLVYSVRDLMPDYLIDLVGGLTTRRFKNRLKVLDFTLKPSRRSEMIAEMMHLLSVFDLTDDSTGPELFAGDFDRDHLPETFFKGYLSLFLDNLPEILPNDPLEKYLVTLINLTGRYVVICGEQSHRPLADRITALAGCTAFATCGDFNRSEMMALANDSAGVIAFEKTWPAIAGALQKPVLQLSKQSDGLWQPDVKEATGLLKNWIIS